MLFCNSHVKLNVSLLEIPIEQVSKMKYSGVWLDQHLNFDDQAEYTAGAFAKTDRLINKEKGLGPWTGIMLYKSLVHPHVFCNCMGLHV